MGSDGTRTTRPVRLRRLTIACVMLAAAAVALPAAASAASYTGAAGTRSYRLYVPSTYSSRTAMPLFVVLHACTQTADSMRQLTQFDQLTVEGLSHHHHPLL